MQLSLTRQLHNVIIWCMILVTRVTFINGGTNVIKIRLKYWRKRRVMNIEQLAKKAKVSSRTIVEIENEVNRDIRPATLHKLANALSINVEELVVDDTSIMVA